MTPGEWLSRLPTAVLVGVAAVCTVAAVAMGVRAQPATPPADAPQGTPVPSAAAPAPQDPLFVSFQGDPVAGQRVVMGATRAGVGGACFSCHGLQGEGDSGGAFPRLANQPAWYLYKQLTDYGNGTRPNDIMTPIAVQLNEQERRDVAAYYAAARAGYRPPPGADPQGLQLGASIAAIGSPTRGIQACVACHGPGGTGIPPDTPYLAGLGAPYIDLQLRLWQEGKRRNDPLGVMADVAKRLSPQERQSVARYFSALQPPGTP